MLIRVILWCDFHTFDTSQNDLNIVDQMPGNSIPKEVLLIYKLMNISSGWSCSISLRIRRVHFATIDRDSSPTIGEYKWSKNRMRMIPRGKKIIMGHRNGECVAKRKELIYCSFVDQFFAADDRSESLVFLLLRTGVLCTSFAYHLLPLLHRLRSTSNRTSQHQQHRMSITEYFSTVVVVRERPRCIDTF